MANIFVGNGTNLTATQTPGSGFSVVVNTGGSITTSGSGINAIAADGGNDIVVAGDVLAIGGNAVLNTGSGSTRITILPTGTMQALSSSAIATSTGQTTIANNGFIGGNISTAGTSTITNGGTIAGGISFAGSSGDTVVNTGRIDGNVLLGLGNDIFTHRGGVVHGFIDGGNGNDIFELEAITPYTTTLRVQGGLGVDTVDMLKFGAAVWIDLDYAGAEAWTRDAQDLNSNSWRVIADLLGVENINGSLGSDYLSGDNLDNVFGLSGGFDTIRGDGGSDTFDPLIGNGVALWIDLTFNGPEVWTQDSVNGVNLAGLAWRAVADLTSIENAVGTFGADFFAGDSANNTFTASSNFLITSPMDVIVGRGGVDTYSAADSSYAVWIDLTSTESEVWSQRLDQVNVPATTWRAMANLSEIENITGSASADFLAGDNANNRIEGRKDIDTLVGRGGADTFVFNIAAEERETSAERDTISDFVAGTDKIGITGIASLPGIIIGSSPTPTNPNLVLLYNTSTGVLSLDVNGNSGGGIVEMAILTGAPTLTASDFILV